MPTGNEDSVLSIKEISIATEGWSKEEIDDVCKIFPTEIAIKRKKLSQFEAIIEPAIIVYIVGSGILGGFLGAIGSDGWNKLKEKFSSRVKEDKNSSFSLEIRDGPKTRKFNLKTDDSSLIEKAFDTMNETLRKNENDALSKFYSDEKTKDWIKIEEGAFIKTVTGICATTTPIRRGKKMVKFSVEVLEKSAPSLVGVPITIGHGGKEIGKITKTWVNDEKLHYEGGIYATASKEDIETFEDIIKNGGGVSIGASYLDDELEEV